MASTSATDMSRVVVHRAPDGVGVLGKAGRSCSSVAPHSASPLDPKAGAKPCACASGFTRAQTQSGGDLGSFFRRDIRPAVGEDDGIVPAVRHGFRSVPADGQRVPGGGIRRPRQDAAMV